MHVLVLVSIFENQEKKYHFYCRNVKKVTYEKKNRKLFEKKR